MVVNCTGLNWFMDVRRTKGSKYQLYSTLWLWDTHRDLHTKIASLALFNTPVGNWTELWCWFLVMYISLLLDIWFIVLDRLTELFAFCFFCLSDTTLTCTSLHLKVSNSLQYIKKACYIRLTMPYAIFLKKKVNDSSHGIVDFSNIVGLNDILIFLIN